MPIPPLSRVRALLPKHARATDTELIAACLGGEAAAWDALIARYEALIFSLPVRMGLSQADAEDIFQNVCVLLLHHLAELRDTERLAGWLVSTTRREVWRVQKRRSTQNTREVSDQEWLLEGAESVTDPSQPLPEATLLALTDQQLVREAMIQLPDRCRLLLTLLYCEDPPAAYTDVAQELNIPLGSIGPTRARCLQRLQKRLDELGF
jgi:RNA polymerase sigma factor (sigma-70 family)